MPSISVDRVLRRDFAHLQIGARGDVANAAAQLFDEIGQPGELPVLQDAVRESAAGTCRNPAPAPT